MKESHPVESAEFARARGIDTEPAFVWWVSHTLKKRDVIISSVKSRIRRITHKYGQEVPSSLEHARKINLANGNSFWSEAIENKMTNVGIAFEVLENTDNMPVG